MSGNNHPVPLSYTPVNIGALTVKLQEYATRPHSELITDFEDGIKEATGSPHVVALNSGSAAIHLGLISLGVGEDDYVIVSTFTYVASVMPVLYLKAIPVLVDSEPVGWNIDPTLLGDAITSCIAKGKKPKAIIVVHTYGMPAAMDEITALSKLHDIPILEDSAEAIGSKYNGQMAGTFGTIGVLSFNNNKIATTYGGGAILTNDKSRAEKILFWSTQSRENRPYYQHEETGYNYRMGALNAAMGLVALKQLKDLIDARRKNFDAYRIALSGVRGVQFQDEAKGSFSNRWLSCILVENHKLDELRQYLAADGIETRPLWKPMHLQPVFKDAPAFVNGRAENLYQRGICLPSGEDLTLNDHSRVVALIKAVLG